MSGHHPSISVVIPVFNGERFLGEAVESALAQTLPPSEIIIADDGSTDKTFEVVRHFGSHVKYAWHPHGGVAVARNHGLAAASCEWIAFLDADDVWLPEKLSRQAACLMAAPDLQYVTTCAEIFLEPGCAWPQNFKPEMLEQKLFGLLSSFLGRRTVFERVGGFEPELITAEDMDWFARAKDLRVPCVLLEEALLRKRVHSTNLTVTTDANVTKKFLLRVMKEKLNRQRLQSQPG